MPTILTTNLSDNIPFLDVVNLIITVTFTDGGHGSISTIYNDDSVAVFCLCFDPIVTQNCPILPYTTA